MYTSKTIKFLLLKFHNFSSTFTGNFNIFYEKEVK